MASSPEHDPKQASQALPPIEKIKNWNASGLLDWIQKNRPNLFQGDQRKKFGDASIPGEVFLTLAGDEDFFIKCELPLGTSRGLANLASELARRETAGVRSKLLFSMPCTQYR
jgi:hypothetical protein